MRIVLSVIALLIAVAFGVWLGGRLPSDGAPQTEAGNSEPLYWVAPMDPNYRRDGPGKSPMGMDLVPVYADDQGGETDDEDAVRIAPAIVASLGVRTEPAALGSLERVVNTVGYVSYDEDSLEHIHSRVEGWIEELETRSTGASVKAGQTLLALYSPPLVTAQEEYLAARASGNAVLRRASIERLRAMGMTAGQMAELSRSGKASERVRIVAESDGVVANLFVREGMFVAPATHLLSIGNLSSVWLHAEVLERQAEWVAVDAPATVRLDALPGREWAGTVDFIYPELDPVTRTLKVRVRLDNPDGALRPNMLAEVTIASPPTAPVVHVPREAVIRGDIEDRVVLALGEGRFRVVPVRAGVEASGRVAIRTGLEAGDRVVVSGQFLIDSEASIAGEVLRMTPAEPEMPMHEHHHHEPGATDDTPPDAPVMEGHDHHGMHGDSASGAESGETTEAGDDHSDHGAHRP